MCKLKIAECVKGLLTIEVYVSVEPSLLTNQQL